MAGYWIKIELGTPDKPEVIKMAATLRLDQDAVVGKLVRVWIWANQNSVDGNAVTVTDSFLDRLTAKRGFAAALRSVGWLAGADGALRFANFDRHNGASAIARAETNRRVAQHRQRNASGVTPPLPPRARNVTPEALPKPLPEVETESERVVCVPRGSDIPSPSWPPAAHTTHTAQPTDFSPEAMGRRWPGIDIVNELKSADRYLRKQRGTTEPQDVDLAWFEKEWLPRAGPKASGAAGKGDDVPPEPKGWQAWLDAECSGSRYSKGGDDYGTAWAKLDAFTREFITEKMKGTA
jgi:hypothetical protein